MSFYKNNIYPYLVDKLGDPPPIKKIRQKILPFAKGKVLEIGVGSGANFEYYDSTKVNKLYALEPNPGMIRLAEKRKRRMKLDVEFIDLVAERIPLEEKSIDTVVSTFTLCTISNLDGVVKGVARVLKPGGHMIFFELGRSPDPRVQRRQRQLEPICRWLFQGLYLTRDMTSILERAGFQINQLDMGYIAEFPKSLSYCWWGKATKA